jgi:hypothetical protein
MPYRQQLSVLEVTVHEQSLVLAFITLLNSFTFSRLSSLSILRHSGIPALGSESYTPELDLYDLVPEADLIPEADRVEFQGTLPSLQHLCLSGIESWGKVALPSNLTKSVLAGTSSEANPMSW